jgi:hypothetical protein
MEKIMEFIRWAKNNGWKINVTDTKTGDLPFDIMKKYNIPDDYKTFLETVEVCQKADNSIWFVCGSLLLVNSNMFRWDDLGPAGLKETNEDVKTNNQTLKYLKKYFPIIFNAKTGCIFLIHQKDNKILKSNGVEFDKGEIVSDNFEELLEKIMNREIEL